MTAQAEEPTLNIVRPTPGENLTITNGSTFVIGTVSPPRATVVVNGAKADVSDDGAFLAFAPVKLLPKPQSIKAADGKQKRVDAVFELVARAAGEESRKRILMATPAMHKVAEPVVKPFAKPLPYRLKEEQIFSRTATTKWGLLHLPAGAYVTVDARKDKLLRLRIADTDETWVDEDRLQPLKESLRLTKPVTTNSGPPEIWIGSETVVPYTITQVGGSLHVTMHVPDHPAQLSFALPRAPIWGIGSHYEGNTLVVTLRPPPVGGMRAKVICLDPGHNPDTGAVGPRGLAERTVNLKIGLALEKLLANAGAKVVFTHRDEGLPLLQRRPAALKLNPDIFVSLHNNSVPDGTDPRTNFGTSTFYYHPHSKPLADSVQAAMLKGLGWPDQKVNRKSLAVCRISEFPAILVEPAYIILPDQEKFLMSEAGQQKIAQLVFDGIRSFLEGSY